MSNATRLAFLRGFGLVLDAPPIAFSDLGVPGELKRRIVDALISVLALGDRDAERFVTDALAERGWTDQQLKETLGRIDRAGTLWALDTGRARNLLTWWHGNWVVRQRERTEVFEAPPQGELATQNRIDQARLKSLIQDCLKSHLGSSGDILEFAVSWRPAGLTTREQRQIIQIDTKTSNLPEEVEVEIDGRIERLPLRFVASIVILIDPQRSRIHVASREKRRGLRAALAQAAVQVFYGRSVDPRPPPSIRVYPGKMKSPKPFGWDPAMPLDDVRPCILSYRRSGRRDLRTVLECEDPKGDIYTAPELSDGPDVDVYRAGIAFIFPDRGLERPERRRVAYLVQPIGLSFPYFSLEEEELAMRVLADNGLIDPAGHQSDEIGLPLLDHLMLPRHSSWLKAALAPQLLTQLREIGAFRPGPPSDRAICQHCLETRTVERKVRNGDEHIFLTCKCETRDVMPDELSTTVFDPGAFATWLRAQLPTDASSIKTAEEGVWDLGVVTSESQKNPISVLFAIDLSSPSRLQWISEKIASWGKRPAGIVLTPSDNLHNVLLAGGWRIVALDHVVTRRGERLVLNVDAILPVSQGRSPKRESTKAVWEDVAATFGRMRTRVLEQKLGAFAVATLLIQENPERWDLPHDSIYRWLRRNFSSEFAKRADNEGPTG